MTEAYTYIKDEPPFLSAAAVIESARGGAVSHTASRKPVLYITKGDDLKFKFPRVCFNLPDRLRGRAGADGADQRLLGRRGQLGTAAAAAAAAATCGHRRVLKVNLKCANGIFAIIEKFFFSMLAYLALYRLKVISSSFSSYWQKDSKNDLCL